MLPFHETSWWSLPDFQEVGNLPWLLIPFMPKGNADILKPFLLMHGSFWAVWSAPMWIKLTGSPLLLLLSKKPQVKVLALRWEPSPKSMTFCVCFLHVQQMPTAFRPMKKWCNTPMQKFKTLLLKPIWERKLPFLHL